MKTRSELALKKFLSGYNCAQAVLFSFCDDLGFEQNTALKLACGFGAGMGRKQAVCGAISGGILASDSNTDAARARTKRPRRPLTGKCVN